MAEDKNYTNNTERPREDEKLEIGLMKHVRQALLMKTLVKKDR